MLHRWYLAEGSFVGNNPGHLFAVTSCTNLWQEGEVSEQVPKTD